MTAIAAASGCISLVEDNLADCLASLTTFQTWSGTVDDATAKAKIYHDLILTADEERKNELSKRKLESIRPYASIYWENFRIQRRTSSGSTDFPNPTHILWLEFVGNYPKTYRDTPRAAEREFKNSIGGIITAFFKACNAPGYQDLRDIEMPEGLGRSKPEDFSSVGDLLMMRFKLTVGGGGQ